MNDVWIELRLWRQFVAVAEELHFGRAAARLHMTQPPLTQAIAALEGLLGVRLFDRTKRSVRLTSAGAALLPSAQDLLARARELPVRARAAAAGELGRLRLAFVSTVGFSHLPEWVRLFRTQFPDVKIELVEATGDVQLAALQAGQVDAGFVLHAPGFTPAGLNHLRVASEPLILALPDAHPLAVSGELRLSDVLAQPLVMFPRHIAPSLHDAVFAVYHGAGRLPVVTQEAIQMQTIVNLVSAGLGVAWVPESVRQFQRPGVRYREVKAGRGAAWCETSLVWVDADKVPALARFLAFVKTQITPER